ncbi:MULTISPECIES: EVE domain-containing protein [unclassified Modestobacter]|uniref:EVE domain-containing protein n=1 Tax=unclassified Modestobacter TaxID=2643866 RepID=UPI0022AA07C0|nr:MULTISPECIES: EVE domain-containing protein [unclassified Modestobacter]MCZ2826041.1 EVE domain-containing protein [Modestobacter sp. VKM Ac-2981]MCZ2852894.1 EVE domain-containing protein [Modestobacter sp. VKM Ac-2982]
MAWVFVLGESNALDWVVANRRMGLGASRSKTARLIEPGDPIALYASTRVSPDGQAQIFAIGRVAGSAVAEPVEVSYRDVAYQIPLDFEHIVKPGEGLRVAPLVDELDFITNKGAWRFHFFNAVTHVPEADWKTISRAYDQQVIGAGA